MQNKNYFGFADWPDVIWQFSAPQAEAAEPEMVYAVYSTPPYEGAADVIYRRGDKWFHVNGGHCSCYGLEDQWEPEEIDPSVHLAAIATGKKVLLVSDSEGATAA
jgi:hypothetical protein